MFKITPLNDPNLSSDYLALCGAKPIENAFIYAMFDLDDGTLMGISQFEIHSEYGYIYDIKPRSGLDDFEAMFILGRQTMNFIETCGPKICRAETNSAEASLLKAIGFKKENDDFLSCDMTGMFDGSHCSGGHKNI